MNMTAHSEIDNWFVMDCTFLVWCTLNAELAPCIKANSPFNLRDNQIQVKLAFGVSGIILPIMDVLIALSKLGLIDYSNNRCY